MSFQTGCFPDILKIAKLIPLFKSGDSVNIGNYRPLAILSVFSKIFEEAFCSRMVNFLMKFSKLNMCQHGFMKGKSTSTAIAGFVTQVVEALDTNENVFGVFYDFSKAFDSVNHEKLLMKLNALGISGVASDWIRSFLLNRKQVVEIINNEGIHHSSTEITNIGVPQGSIIAPYLFIIYTNDISEYVDRGSLLLYADDTTHLLTSNDFLLNSPVSGSNVCARDVG